MHLSKAEEENPSAWGPVIQMEYPDGAVGSWFQPGPGLTIVAIWGGKQQMEDLSL